MPIQEGFQGQRLVVVSRPVVAEALSRPVTRRLLVTDVGYYPNAIGHQMNRPRGAEATIVVVCASGTGWARVGDVVHRIGAQQALVIPSGVPHSYGADEQRPWTIWWAHVAGTDAAELVESMDVTAGRPLVPIRGLDRAVALLDEIVSNLERDQSPPRLVSASGAAWKLLAHISVDRLLPKPDDPLQRAMNYLSDRLDGSVRVPDLARLVGVSPSHLSALFHRATGGGVHAHHTALRMARARQLLDTTDATIADVASEVGYDDAFYFSRAFRRHHRMSPSGFRSRDS
ncbi:helix-turn-helix domain-containing protein [Herbiconiux sp. CPCC 205763]|uniref:Helix-turn-helix domain-containing protein n=1 Tax=Herbiconiux aconitum TaxID=2970913 RepID=A0ABT2GZI4_9MICO|nr:AraC family transcriptional regulator [Herbiconiux aconitum]MCS5720349.1 helix-turn-helix domain-containing protein [Herbiconiux aconitum]